MGSHAKAFNQKERMPRVSSTSSDLKLRADRHISWETHHHLTPGFREPLKKTGTFTKKKPLSQKGGVRISGFTIGLWAPLCQSPVVLALLC